MQCEPHLIAPRHSTTIIYLQMIITVTIADTQTVYLQHRPCRSGKMSRNIRQRLSPIKPTHTVYLRCLTHQHHLRTKRIPLAILRQQLRSRRDNRQTLHRNRNIPAPHRSATVRHITIIIYRIPLILQRKQIIRIGIRCSPQRHSILKPLVRQWLRTLR